MNNLIKSVISFWATCILVLVIAFTILYNFSLQYEDWGKPYGSEVLANNLKVFLTYNIAVSIFVVLVCLGLIFLVRRVLKTPISVSGILLGIISIFIVGGFNDHSYVISYEEYVPLLIMFCLSLMVIIISHLNFLNRIRLPQFVLRRINSYVPLCIGIITFLVIYMPIVDDGRFSRASDNENLVRNFWGTYEIAKCQPISKSVEGYEINYDTKNWQEFDWFVEFEDVAPVDVYIRKIGRAFEEIYILLEPYDATRYYFDGKATLLADPFSKKFTAKHSLYFKEGKINQNVYYDVEYNYETNMMDLESTFNIAGYNQDEYKFEDWELKAYQDFTKIYGGTTMTSIEKFTCERE